MVEDYLKVFTAAAWVVCEHTPRTPEVLQYRLFQAEKEHLNKYGRLIFSGTTEFEHNFYSRYDHSLTGVLSGIITGVVQNDYVNRHLYIDRDKVYALAREPELDLLSETDRWCLSAHSHGEISPYYTTYELAESDAIRQHILDPHP